MLVEGALANAANDKELSRHDMKQTAALIRTPCQSYVLLQSSGVESRALLAPTS